MNKFIHIDRYFGDDKHTIGSCAVYETELDNDLITVKSIRSEKAMGKLLPRFISCSLERGWQDNKPDISCIPVGEYHCVLEWSPRFKQMLWEIYGVDGRSECKFHVSNFYKQLNGCVALGLRTLDLDGDLQNDLTRSKDALAEFHNALRPMEGKQVKLIVV